MSAKVSGKVWDLDLPHNQLLVLLALADHADHDGNNVFPSIGLVAWKTGYSEDQVRRIMAALRKSGILVEVSKTPGKVTKYRINLDAGKVKPPRIAMQPLAKSNPLQDDTSTPPQDATSTPRIAVQPESSVNRHIEPSLSRKSAKGSKSTISAELMNPMKDAIVIAFGWSWKDMTKTEIGIVQSTAKELCTAGFEPDRVASFHAWCRAKFTSFTPRVMATHLSEYRNSRLNGNSETEKVYAAPYHKPIVIEENSDAIPMPQEAKDAIQMLKDKMCVKDGYHATTKTTD